MQDNIWTLHSSKLTNERKLKFEKVASQRTEHIRLAIQDLHHPHNVAACLRSAEAFGVLNVDIISEKERFKVSTVARGVEKWLRLKVFSDISKYAATIKSKGYKIAAGYPTQEASPLCKLPVTDPLVLVFANEHEGASQKWDPFVDYKFTIPMFGMVESLNISVSCAITLNETTTRARTEIDSKNYYVNDTKKNILLEDWLKKQLHMST